MHLLNQYANEVEASIDKGYLEANGIDAILQFNSLSEIFPAPGSGSGDILLYVPDSQATEALRLMQEREE